MTRGTKQTPVVAVTGAAGYIGSRVVWQLQHDHPDWDVVAFDNFYLGEVRQIGAVDVRDVDIRDREQLEAALDGTDAVVHLAAISGVDDCTDHPALAYEVNAVGTMNVAWFCKHTNTPLAFPFSMAVVGDPDSFPIQVNDPREPLNWYGQTKVLGERMIEELSRDAFPAHLFMISNLYGGHTIEDREITKGTVINFFVNQVLAAKPITVYEPGTQARNFVHVKDVANALCLSVEELVNSTATGASKFEVASDSDPSVRQVGEVIQRVAEELRGAEVDIEMVPNPRQNETLVDRFDVDTRRIESVLGWSPERSIEESVRHLLSEDG
jgi:nucleoside-diphosphate-sugar epimerase